MANVEIKNEFSKLCACFVRVNCNLMKFDVILLDL